MAAMCCPILTLGYPRVPVCLNLLFHRQQIGFFTRVPTGTRVFKQAVLDATMQFDGIGYPRVPVCLNVELFACPK